MGEFGHGSEVHEECEVRGEFVAVSGDRSLARIILWIILRLCDGLSNCLSQE